MVRNVFRTRCFREAQRWGLKLGGSPSDLAVPVPLTLAAALFKVGQRDLAPGKKQFDAEEFIASS